MSLRIRQRLDKYRVVSKLGAGGFAHVYRARDTVEGVDVALKVPHQAILTKEVKFKDDRMDLIAGMQFLVADPANYRLLDDALTFSEEKDLARSLWGN